MYHATAKEMEFLYKKALENGIEPSQTMELAGWHMLVLLKNFGISVKSNIVVVCGKGNKGGDGLSSARHLLNNGYRTSVVLVSNNISKDARQQLDLLKKMDAQIIFYKRSKSKVKELLKSSTLIIDALIGFKLTEPPREIFKEIIILINESKKNVISYDIPTGIDSTTGECFEPCIKAYATLCLALPKKAFTKSFTKTKCGKIFVADIGIPHFLYDQISPNCRPQFGNAINMLAPI